MTLAVVMVTPQVAFAGADRRYSGVEAVKDFKAIKICSLETTDAHGLLTFAGIGARASREPFELSEWVTHVLRGYKRTLDESLQAIAQAATEQRMHLMVPGHAFAFGGFKDRAVTLQIVTSQTALFSMETSGKSTKLEVPGEARPFRVINLNFPHRQKVAVLMLGSGAPHVNAKRLIDLARQGRRARTKEEGGARIGSLWAWINRKVSMRQADVGPECICAWRYRDGGGNHVAYAADGTREANTGMMPAVGQGMPISDIVGRLFEHMQGQLAALAEGREIEMNQEITDRLMEGLSMKPRTKF